MDGIQFRSAFDRSTCREVSLLVLICLPYLSGCAQFGGTSLPDWVQNGFKVGPNYRKPAAPLNCDWANRTPSAEPDCDSDTEAEKVVCAKLAVPHLNPDCPVQEKWWTVFNDPILNELVLATYQQNLTVQEAGLRVLEARALRSAAVGNIFPQTQVGTGSYLRQQRPGALTSNLWNFGFTLGWELDFWGKFRRRIEAVDANYNAAIEGYDFVLLSRIADVAETYVEIRTLENRIQIACENAKLQANTAARAFDSVRNGGGDELEASLAKEQADTNVYQTLASIPALKASLSQAYNRLSVLLGRPPRDLHAMLAVPAQQVTYLNGEVLNEDIARTPIPLPLPGQFDVDVGLPANLLRRRPDVRVAERTVAAQSAELGVAVTDLYPAFSLTGNLSWSAADFGDVFRTNSFGGLINPTFNWKLLNYGRVQANIRANEAKLARLAVSYQNTVLGAQLEAENAMAAYLRSYERVQLLEQATRTARAADPVKRQYNRWSMATANFSFVSQATLLRNEDDLAKAKQALATSLITLYKALGGGWEIRFQSGSDQPTRFCRLPPVDSLEMLPAPEIRQQAPTLEQIEQGADGTPTP